MAAATTYVRVEATGDTLAECESAIDNTFGPADARELDVEPDDSRFWLGDGARYRGFREWRPPREPGDQGIPF
jgi:hypothetical protein